MSESRLLKAGLSRSVRVVPGPDGGAVVVKRFRDGGLFPRLFRDRRRARREFRLLERFHALGLPVPSPRGLRRSAGGGWEVEMQWIEDARGLDEVLAGRAPWPRSAGRVAGELGALLARFERAGLSHGDLHAGNVLLDADRAWVVDFHDVHLGDGGRADDPLVVLAAGVRESTSRWFRARFLVAWDRERRPGRERSPQVRSSLAGVGADVEARARVRRREVVFKRRRRWLRESGDCRVLDEGGHRLFVRRDVPLDAALDLAARAASEGDARRPGDAILQLVRGADARESWFAAARLAEHGIAAARPVAHGPGASPWSALELPPGSEAAARPAPNAAGALAGALLDRCVWPRPATGLPMLWRTSDDGLALGPVAALDPLGTEPRGVEALQRRSDPLARALVAGGARFGRACIAALDPAPGVRAAWERALGLG